MKKMRQKKKGKKIEKDKRYRKFKRIDHKKLKFAQNFYNLWLLDNQIRPCFGTTDFKGSGRYTPDHLDKIRREGTKERVKALLEQMTKAEIPLDEGVMTYNYDNKTIPEFHLKYAMSPEVYTEKFLKLEEFTQLKFKPTHGEMDKIREWYNDEYYGDKLRELQGLKEIGRTNTTHMGLIHAKNYEDVMKTGSVVLYDKGPVKTDDLKDDVIVAFEKAVRNTFPKKTWFAVCLYVTKHVNEVGEAELLIGAKIAEKQFILEFQKYIVKHIGKVEVDAFLNEHKYKNPTRNYWNE